MADFTISAFEISSGCSRQRSALFARPTGREIILSERKPSPLQTGIFKGGAGVAVMHPTKMQAETKMKR